MNEFLLTPLSIGFLAQCLLLGAMAGFGGVMAWGSSRAGGSLLKHLLMPAAFGWGALLMALLFGEAAFEGPFRFGCLFLQNGVAALCIGCLLQFAYRGLGPPQPSAREAAVVLGLSLAYFLWEGATAWARFRTLSAGDVIYRPASQDYPLVLGFGWLVVVLLRRTVMASTEGAAVAWWRRLAKPQGQEARALRAMALVGAWLALVAASELPATYPFMRETTTQAIRSIGTLAGLFVFGVVYLNHFPHQASLSVRFIGGTWFMVLALLGIAGWVVPMNFIAHFSQHRPMEDRRTIRFTPQEEGYDVEVQRLGFDWQFGERVAATASGEPASLGFVFPFFGQGQQEARISRNGWISFGPELEARRLRLDYGPTPAVIALLANFEESRQPAARGQVAPGIYRKMTANRLTVTWHRMVVVEGSQRAETTMQVALSADGTIELRYAGVGESPPFNPETPTRSHWMSGLNAGRPGFQDMLEFDRDLPRTVAAGRSILADHYRHFRQDLHLLLLPLAGLTLGSSLFVLGVFPAFFRVNLLRPLEALLEGVRRVNAGQLATVVPVHFNDDIGFLAASFNRMVASLQAAQGELERTNEVLEHRVELRTTELAQTNAHLREEIARRSQIEAQLQEARRMAEAGRQAAEAASRAKSEFLANMSHEIRTPLNGVIGMSALLLDGPLNAAQREQAETVRDCAESLLGVINDILDLSKIEAGKLDLEAVDFHLREVLKETVGWLGHRARQKGLPVELNVPEALPQALRGDPGRLRQVLVNLLGNAIKFTHQGRITLSVTPGETANRPVKGSCALRFEVTDTGIGIPADRLSGLFTPFTQVDGSTTRRFGGTGLGLSISKRLVQMMGGDIGVRNNPAGGSTFWFTAGFAVGVPPPPGPHPQAIVPPAAAPASATTFRLRHGRPARVLVAEDNPVNQKVAVALLHRLGCESEIVGTGLAALAALRARDYDLVLMDIQMPELDGLEATRHLRAPGSGVRDPHVPVVALTAHAMKGDDQKCLEAGMDDYLPKPLHPSQLGQVLERWLRPRVQTRHPRTEISVA